MEEGITERDLDKYRRILGEEGQYMELLTWDESYPIRLYKEKGYKQYKGNYLTVIYEGVMDNLEINLDRRSRDTNTGRYVYLTKYNQWFEVTLETGDINHENTSLVECGSEHLEEFIDYVIEDSIHRVYESYVNGKSAMYSMYLLDQIRVKGITKRMYSVRETLDKTPEEMDEYLERTAYEYSIKYYNKYEEELSLGDKEDVNLENIHVKILKNVNNEI